MSIPSGATKMVKCPSGLILYFQWVEFILYIWCPKNNGWRGTNEEENKLYQRLSQDIIEADTVNSPTHYTKGEIECIDAIKSAVIGKNGFEAYCVGNITKYLWRYEEKGGVESVKKAEWYLKKLLEELK